MYIKWITTNEEDEIYFPDNIQKAELASLGKINFHFGSWKRELSVRFIEDLSNDTIGLSRNLKEEVFIPDDLLYKIKITEDSVSLGPVILYLVSKRFIKRLDKLKKRIENFIPLNGLIYVSTVSGINTKKRLIKGYYFQPKSATRESNWKEGIFPYPGAIFKRVPLPRKINEHLYEMTNSCIFNSKFFNKWEMWEWLASDKFIRSHLPYTKELNTLDEINNMLDDYPSIYLKPKNGSKGKGIIQIKRDDHSFQITNDKNVATKVESLDRNPIIKSVLSKGKRYIIQQGVPVKHDSRNVDFRIYMQKDETIEDSKLYGEIIRNPFLYASAIAGFSSEMKLQSELKQSKGINDHDDKKNVTIIDNTQN